VHDTKIYKNVYYDKPDIYTIFRFPIIAYPTYKIIKIIALPVHNHKNIFTFVKINYSLLTIDKENHHMLPDRDKLQTCVKDVITYTCDQNLPIYYAEADAPCEVQVYMKGPKDRSKIAKNDKYYSKSLYG